MKRAISVLCLFAMLLSLATVMTVSTSAVDTSDGKTASYTETAPDIDGVKDESYASAKDINVNSAARCVLKILWNEQGLYIFAEVKSNFTSIDFYISGIAYTMDTATSWWKNKDGSEYVGNYFFEIKKDGTLATPMSGNNTIGGKSVYTNITTYHVPDGFDYKVETTDVGFNAEMFIPMKDTDWNIKRGAGKSRIGFGAATNRNFWYTSNYPGGTYAYPYSLKALDLNCTPAHNYEETMTIDTAPTLTTAGAMSRHCKICGAKTEETEIPATTIQWLGVQGLTTIPDGATTTSVRLVSQIKDLDGFSAVGYEITASTGTVRDKLTPKGSLDKEMTAVYQSILAAGEKVEPKDGGQYLVAIVMDDIPLKDADGNDLYVSFTVKPYTKDAAGNKVYMTGTDTVTFVLKAGVLVTD